MSGDVLQRKLDEVYQDCSRVKGIAYDMLTIDQGKGGNRHDSNFHKFIEDTRKNNLCINAKKLQFKLKEVSFYRHHWSAEGLNHISRKSVPLLP